MPGTVERETKDRVEKARGVRDIVSMLTDRHTAPVFPAMSDHHRVPGAIGSVLIPSELRKKPIEDWGLEAPHGFDSDGEYH